MAVVGGVTVGADAVAGLSGFVAVPVGGFLGDEVSAQLCVKSAAALATTRAKVETEMPTVVRRRLDEPSRLLIGRAYTPTWASRASMFEAFGFSRDGIFERIKLRGAGSR